jgi:RNA polymerase sigma-70 factor (ECF subfamily)
MSPDPILAPLDALRAVARAHSRVSDEADDLLQDALLEAVRAGRADLSQAANYRWITGTIRNLGSMRARGAVRRRLREARWTAEEASQSELASELRNVPLPWREIPEIVELPPSLRQVALLALSGHDRREIAWLLNVSEAAMRQRIATLRRKLSQLAAPTTPSMTADRALPLGLIRRALLPVVVASQSAGAHDPDGHLLVLSRTDAHVLPIGGNTQARSPMSNRISPE